MGVDPLFEDMARQCLSKVRSLRRIQDFMPCYGHAGCLTLPSNGVPDMDRATAEARSLVLLPPESHAARAVLYSPDASTPHSAHWSNHVTRTENLVPKAWGRR